MSQSPRQSGFRLSLDSWAVLLAIALTILVRSGILKTVSW
jgi:hypothetical protein